jgi:PAS domain S-box-containing protein
MGDADKVLSGKPQLVGSGSYFSGVIHHAGDPIICCDLAGMLLSFNPAAEAFYGYPAAEVIGQPLTMLVLTSRRAEVESWLRAVVQEQRAVRYESENVDRQGRIFHVSMGMSPIIDGGDVVGVATWTVNISERVAVQSTLQEERNLVEAILEATNDAIVVVDPLGQIVAANLQFEIFFQLPRYQWINHPVSALIDQVRARADLPGDLANILLTFVGDKSQSAGGDFEVGAPMPRTLIWYSAPVYAHDGTNIGRLFVFRDATREREADRMKSEFVSLVSHELRTPTTSIRGFIDLLLEGDAGPIDAPVREYLEIVKVNADRLITLVNDVLDISRIEAGRIEVRRDLYSITAIIDSVVQTMYPLIEARQQCLVVRAAEDLPLVSVDRERMTQVVTNLVGNASKYTPSGGEVTIEAHQVDTVEALTPGAPSNVILPALLVAVHDTGIGIASKDQVQLFNRFFRTEQATRRQISGTGLGLTIVKSFVELHGGHVWINSEIERGSSFYFTIPLLEGT